MNNMEDVSSQLMRPPRELASWNFPLSSILEEYFNLLPEPCKISFGEAAFIIQNSVNAYVRRVEELYDETKCFNQKIVTEEQEAEKNNKKDKKLKKNVIDLSQFETISFKKDIGKNINLKRHEQKPIKFLHQCFSQLENSHSRLNIKVFDNQGEVIGKKYDFRCNQHMNKNGTLVEEFSLKDFENVCEASSPERSPYTGSREEFQSPLNSNFLSVDEDDSFIEDPTVAETESFYDCNEGDNIERYDQSSDDELFTLVDSGINDSPVTDFQENNDESLNDDKNEATSSLSESESHNIQDEVPHDSGIELNPEKSNEKECEESLTNEVENSSKPEPKKSKRLKRKLVEEADQTEGDDPNLMLPIPFQNGIPEKLEKSRKEFKLPCNIALLKRVPKRPAKSRKSEGKKIKLTNNEPKDNSNLPPEVDVLEHLKCQLYSPSGPLLSTKEENPNGFRRNLDESFNVQRSFSLTNLPQYQPVMTLTSDLLGFAPTETKSDPQSLPSEGELSPSPCRSPSPMYYDAYPPDSPLPPESLMPDQDETSQERRSRKRKKSSHNYNDMVKCKIEEIYKEMDLQTDEDQKVAKWHEEIKPRLKEAELKPPFCIHDYESKIKNKLITSHRKLSFDDIVREEPPCEIARYFSATLQLASTNNLNINSSENPQKSIELILLD